MSPTRTSRAGLARCAAVSILPISQALPASERVLKNRAAHSHLWILTLRAPTLYNERTSSNMERERRNHMRQESVWMGGCLSLALVGLSGGLVAQSSAPSKPAASSSLEQRVKALEDREAILK